MQMKIVTINLGVMFSRCPKMPGLDFKCRGIKTGK